MALYLVQAAYTPESWAHQTRSPESPVDRLRPMTDKLGGRIHSAYYAFGEYDVCVVLELPDNESVAAWSIAASAGGSVKSIKTTTLMTVEQGLGAMRKAASLASAYQAPTGKQLAGV